MFNDRLDLLDQIHRDKSLVPDIRIVASGKPHRLKRLTVFLLVTLQELAALTFADEEERASLNAEIDRVLSDISALLGGKTE